jgi:hypothetical protein
MIFKNIFCLIFLTVFVSASSFYDIELPPESPSDTPLKSGLRQSLTEEIIKVQNSLSGLSLTDEQNTNYGALLKVYTKAWAAAIEFSPELFKVEKGLVTMELLDKIRLLDRLLADPFSKSMNCGFSLARFNRYFEFNFPQGYKELEALCGNKDAFNLVAELVDNLDDLDVNSLKGFTLPNPEEIVSKAEALKTEIKKSRFNLGSLVPIYKDIFEPFEDKLGLQEDSLPDFVYEFVQYALFHFYDENFSTSLEISNVLFGADSKLKDLDGNLLSEKLGSTDLKTELSNLAFRKLDAAKFLLPSTHPLSDDLKKELLDSLFKRFSKHKPQSDKSDPLKKPPPNDDKKPLDNNVQKPNTNDEQITPEKDDQPSPDRNVQKPLVNDDQNPPDKNVQKPLTNDGQHPPDNNLKFAAALIVVVLLIVIGLAAFFIMRRKSINA